MKNQNDTRTHAREELQKFTDFSSKALIDSHMEQYSQVTEEIANKVLRLISRYVNEASLANDTKEWTRRTELGLYFVEKYCSKERSENFRNTLWAFNHGIILNEIHEGIKTHGHIPTIQAMASKIGLSRTTIYKHLEDIKTGDYHSEVRMQQNALVESALTELYKIGIQDRNPTALKNFVQLTNPETKARVVNNYIQINNIKLSQEDIASLPKETILEIEKLLQKSNL